MAPKKPPNSQKFWLVCRDPSTVAAHQPAHAIRSKHDAWNKAEALAKETGYRFYVMEAVASCEPSTPPIEWTLHP